MHAVVGHRHRMAHVGSGGTSNVVDRSGAWVRFGVSRPGPTAVFSGVGVALVTLFDDEGEIDAPATADHAARLVAAGVSAVVVAGTTARRPPSTPTSAATSSSPCIPRSTGGCPCSSAPAPRPPAKQWCCRSGPKTTAPMPSSCSHPRTWPTPARTTSKYRGWTPGCVHYPKASSPGVPVDVLRELPVAGIKDSSGDAERLILEADERTTGLNGLPVTHPPGRCDRLLRCHPRAGQRRPRRLRPCLDRRRHRAAGADQRPPRPVAVRHRRPQAHPLRPPRHLARDARLTPPVL